LFLSLFGGVLGLGLASLMQLVSVSTMNWQSFSEIAFRFSLTPRIVVQSLAFAAVMGLLGGVLPAARAAGLKIVDALRAA
jgi:ABC-type antimicrobial peptide transport system permease subunit